MKKGNFLKRRTTLLFYTVFMISMVWSQNVDLKKNDVWPWIKSSTFDRATAKFETKELYTGFTIPYSYNATNYDYLEIKYKQATGSFGVRVEYEDKSTDMIGCAVYDNCAYISLDKVKRSKISSIAIESYMENISFTIESLTFTNNKPVLPAIVDKKEGDFDTTISGIDLAKNMKVGWNLAMTLEAHDNNYHTYHGLAAETYWHSPYTTKEIIHLPKATGYSSIRIPVTWYYHIIDDKYTIDPKWMARVKQIVDWAIEDGYYVILNEHHSKHDNMNSPIKYGEGYIVRNTPEDIAESERFLKAIWTQIATAFNGSYDEHLVFEFMNEPTNAGHEHEWDPGLVRYYGEYRLDSSNCKECLADYKILNEYNQVCLDAIRSTGGNNAQRFVIVPALCEQEQPLLHKLFKLPEDIATGKLMVTTHNYDMGVREEYVKNKYTPEMESSIKKTYSKLNKAFVEKGIPVILGETHTLRSVPLKEREKWAKSLYKIASSYGIPVLYWEDEYNLSNHFDRNNLTVIEPDFVKLMIDSWQCK